MESVLGMAAVVVTVAEEQNKFENHPSHNSLLRMTQTMPNKRTRRKGNVFMAFR